MALVCAAVLLVPAGALLAQTLGTTIPSNTLPQGLLQQLPPGVTADQAQRFLQSQNPAANPNNPTGTETPTQLQQQIYVTSTPAIVQSISALETLYSRRARQKLSQFGYDLIGNGGTPWIFNSNGIQVPVGNGSFVSNPQIGAVQDSYILGPGDQINVTFRGDQNSSFTATIARDGTVALPNMSPIPAAGRSFGEFRADVERAAQQTYVRTRVFLSVSQLRQLSVRVVGDVTNPGTYQLNGLSTVLDALNLAGGIKKTGSLRNITIVRGGRTLKVDLYGMLTTGETPDITIAQGDRIVVPAIGQTVAVMGDVRRPAIYELAPGASAMTAPELLSLAQGMAISGVYRETLLKNRPDGKQELVDIPALAQASLHDGEILMVRRAVDMSLGSVALAGNVRLEGQFALSDRKTLHDLLPSLDVLAPGSYLLLGVIDRLDPATLQRVPLAFSPLRVIAGKENANLMSEDIVRIFSIRGGQTLATQIDLRRQQALQNQSNIEISGPAPPQQANNQGQNGPVAGTPGTQVVPGTPERAVAGAAPAPPPGAALVYGQATPPYNQAYPNAPEANPAYGPEASPAYGPRTPGLYGQGTAPGAAPYYGQDGAGQNGQYPGANPQSAPADNFSANNPENGGGPERPGLFLTSRDLGGYPLDAMAMLDNRLYEFVVDLSGAVHQPGSYLAAPGTTVADLVATAGGLQADADLSQFEITATTIDNQSGRATVSRQTLPATAQQLSQLALKGWEEVIFHRVSSDQEGGDVRIAGEVRFPGVYHIIRGERLSSLIRRAGGYLPTAYPYGSVFTRISVANAEDAAYSQEADEMESSLAAYSLSGVGALNAASTTGATAAGALNPVTGTYLEAITDRLRNTKALGRLAINADPTVLARRPDLDIALEPGDQLIVPRKPASVNVVGEVRNPSGIVFNADLTADDYIRSAGGMTRLADEGGAFIIYPDGNSAPLSGGFWSIGSPSLSPGSTIVIPRDVTPPLDWADLTSKLATIVGQIALTAASISIVSTH